MAQELAQDSIHFVTQEDLPQNSDKSLAEMHLAREMAKDGFSSIWHKSGFRILPSIVAGSNRDLIMDPIQDAYKI